MMYKIIVEYVNVDGKYRHFLTDSPTDAIGLSLDGNRLSIRRANEDGSYYTVIAETRDVSKILSYKSIYLTHDDLSSFNRRYELEADI